jgi:hypothetical protein
MVLKICPICNKEKFYPKSKGDRKYCSLNCAYISRKGKEYNCKECNTKFIQNNNRHFFCNKICRHRYQNKIHREEINLKSRIFKKENPQLVKEWQRKSNIKNKDKIAQYRKEYRKRPEVKKMNRIRWKEWAKKNEEQVRIRSRLQSHIHKAINRFLEKGKITSSKKPVNLSLTIVAKNLLINLPADYNKRKYHIDHIQPVCSFDLTKEEDILKAYSLENTRWLPAEENLKKVGEDMKKSIWRNNK